MVSRANFNKDYKYMITLLRLLDRCIALMGILITLPLMLIVYILGFFDTGSPIFKQRRVGKNKQLFTLFKFRTMTIDTKSVATHLASKTSITKLGAVLRKTKLDELPQLFNVLKGEMSLVGPRPCLPSQIELIDAREARRVFDYLPGVTGLAQINKVDMSTPIKLAELDSEMLRTLTIKKYFEYIILTALGKGSGDRIR